MKRWCKKTKEDCLLAGARYTYFGEDLHSSPGRRLRLRPHPTPAAEMKTPVKFIPSSKKSTKKSKPKSIEEEGSRVTDVGTVGEAKAYQNNLKINSVEGKFEASNTGAPPALQKQNVVTERANDAAAEKNPPRISLPSGVRDAGSVRTDVLIECEKERDSERDSEG